MAARSSARPVTIQACGQTCGSPAARSANVSPSRSRCDPPRSLGSTTRWRPRAAPLRPARSARAAPRGDRGLRGPLRAQRVEATSSRPARRRPAPFMRGEPAEAGSAETRAIRGAAADRLTLASIGHARQRAILGGVAPARCGEQPRPSGVDRLELGRLRSERGGQIGQPLPLGDDAPSALRAIADREADPKAEDEPRNGEENDEEHVTR